MKTNHLIKASLVFSAFIALTLMAFKPINKTLNSDKPFGGLALYTVRESMWKDEKAT